MSQPTHYSRPKGLVAQENYSKDQEHLYIYQGKTTNLAIFMQNIKSATT
jgi:hypothetical protein